MKRLLITILGASVVGCATLTEDAMTPIAFSFSDGTEGSCKLSNKRGAWEASIPSTMSVRKSDDDLKYDCKSEDGRTAFGSIPSEMGGKIIASAVFIDFGITDAITDKHRRYPPSYVIPLPKANAAAGSVAPATGAEAPKPTEH
jgi:hypothetical protein